MSRLLLVVWIACLGLFGASSAQALDGKINVVTITGSISSAFAPSISLISMAAMM